MLIETGRKRSEATWSRRAERESAYRFIEALAAAAFGVRLAALRGQGRGDAETARARQAAMYLAHVSLGHNLSKVGAHFRRDRTTVAHACMRIEDLREGESYGRVLECLEAAVDRWLASFLAHGGRP